MQKQDPRLPGRGGAAGAAAGAAAVRQRLGAHRRLALLYVMLALGLNIVVGYAGLLDLGYVAFYAVGAYMFGLLASPQLTENFRGSRPCSQRAAHSVWLVIPLALVLAAVRVLLGAPC
jgi:branched-chain amino acid transport system permease protein